MPLVTVSVLEGVFTPAKKQEIIRKITDTLVAIEGPALRSATVVVIHELKSGDFGLGGSCYTTAAVKDLLAAQTPR